MLITPIREALINIKQELKTLMSKSNIIYEAQPVIETLKRVAILIEKYGITDVTVSDMTSKDKATTGYFNTMSYDIYRAMLSIHRIISELFVNTNDAIALYTQKINNILPTIEDLHQRITDIEQQTLEKVTNTSIHAHEIKLINFSKNVARNNLTIINNTLLLPLQSQIQIPVSVQETSVVAPSEATRRLADPIISTDDMGDAETIQGSYIGNIIGKLDGSEQFISESDFNAEALYQNNISSALNINYYSPNLTEEFSVDIHSTFNTQPDINFIFVETNIEPDMSFTLANVKTNLKTYNNIWAQPITADQISIRATQSNYRPLRYHGIDVIDNGTSTIVKRHNYFNSLRHLHPDVLENLNESITTTEIVPAANQHLVLSERTGFVKYNIEVSTIGIYQNTYHLQGIWESDIIVTNKQIHSVEIISDQVLPDDLLEYITYEISFDTTTWYNIRPINAGSTTFNKDIPKRIVLTTDNNNAEYNFIGDQANDMGVYLRISMRSNSTAISPVISSLQVRIKVKDDVASQS